MVLFTIIFVSTTPLALKVMMVVLTIIFFSPTIKTYIFQYGAIWRKVQAALYTSLLFTTGLMTFSMPAAFADQTFNEDYIIGYLFILIVSLIGNFLYGFPVSMVAELLTRKLPRRYRIVTSGFIHFGFGLLTYFFEVGIALPAIICSILFFTIDEFLRKRK
jgi:hypothetical protein